MINLTIERTNKVTAKQLRNAYRDLVDSVNEWNGYFTSSEKSRRSAPVLAHIAHMRQQLDELRQMYAARESGHDKDMRASAVQRAARILVDFAADGE